jgi:hypothetical protein
MSGLPGAPILRCSLGAVSTDALRNPIGTGRGHRNDRSLGVGLELVAGDVAQAEGRLSNLLEWLRPVGSANHLQHVPFGGEPPLAVMTDEPLEVDVPAIPLERPRFSLERSFAAWEKLVSGLEKQLFVPQKGPGLKAPAKQSKPTLSAWRRR